MMRIDICSMSLPELTAYIVDSGFERYRAKQIIEQLNRGAVSFDDMNNIPAALRSFLNDSAYIARADIVRAQRSKIDGTEKFLFELHDGEYVEGVLQSRMGDHNDQGRLFDLLTISNKVELFRRLYTLCRARNISGLTAGSFMIGRFVARPLARKMWNSLSDTIVAFLMNEYVLYEKYQQVLQEVGEIKLARAHSRIETEGIDNMVVKNFDMNNFVPLLYSQHDWNQVATELEHMEHQDNTHLLIEKLSRPIEEIFDMSTPWKASIIQDILKQAEE